MEAFTVEIQVPDSSVERWYRNAPAHDICHSSFNIFEQCRWPAGFGQQPLYDLNVIVAVDDGTLDSTMYASTRIGFRTIRLVQDPISGQKGQTFYFEVNEIPIFAKGSNFIPADCFESRVSEDKLRLLLESCVEANHNMIRIWGAHQVCLGLAMEFAN